MLKKEKADIMLQKIIFYMSPVCDRKECTALKKRLEGEGLEVIFEEAGKVTGILENSPDVLYVSDDKETVARFLKEKRNIAVMFHKGNRKENFSGVSYGVELSRLLTKGVFERIYQRFYGIPWTILQTKRCLVREITIQDVDALYEIYKEPSITRYMENLYEDREKEREYTKKYIANVYGFYGYGIWIVEDKESGEIIGRAGIEQKEEDCPELGYMISASCQGKGYAYEVCRAILQYAGKELGILKIISQVQKGNEASVKLLKKLGFYRKEETREAEGVLEKYEIFLKKHLTKEN